LLKTQSMILARAYFHEKYIDEVLLKIAETGILHQTEALQDLRGTDYDVKAVEPSEKLFRVTSIISRIQTILSNPRLNIEKSLVTDSTILPEGDIVSIDQELLEIEHSYAAITSELAKPEPNAKASADQRLAEFSKDIGRKLLAWKRQLETTRLIEEAKAKSTRTAKTFVVEGWIPAERKTEFEDAVKEGSKGYYGTLYMQPSAGSRPGSHNNKSQLDEQVAETPQKSRQGTHAAQEIENPPSQIRNPRIAYVYEKLVTGFGLPNYFEIDPTIFMIISFPVIFGLMFGDVGHGLLLLFFSILLFVANKKGVKAPELFEYMIKGAPLLVMCSISAIFFGFLYGELFGSEVYYHVVDSLLHGVLGFSMLEAVRSASIGIENTLTAIAGFPIPVPFPFAPFKKPMLLLLISLYVAIIQINLGLVLGLINQLRKRNYVEAIVGPGLWLWFYMSCAYLFLKYKSGILSIVFQRADILGIYIALPAVVMLLARTGLHGMDGFGHSLESLISSLSNSISYGRILALALTHGAFSQILLMFLGLEGPIMAIVGVVMWALFTFLLILCFEGLLSFIQTLRLHWVEWFLKFYSGDGYQYKPLRL